MFLQQQNILQFTINQSILTSNFSKIQEQFTKINKRLQMLTQQTQKIVDKINDQLDPFDQIQNCLIDEPYTKNELANEQLIGKSVSEINYIQQSHNSKTEIQVKKQLESIEYTHVIPASKFKKNNRINTQTQSIHSKRQSSSNSRVVNLKTQQSSQQQNRRSSNHQSSQNHRNIHDNLIKDLDARLTAIEEEKLANQQKIELLQKDNQRIKNFIGMRRKQKVSNAHKSGKNCLSSKNKKQASIKDLTDKSRMALDNQLDEKQKNSSNSQQEYENTAEDNFLTGINKQIQNIKQYLQSKFQRIDQDHEKIRVYNNENSQKMSQIINSMTQKFQELQEKDKDVSVLVANSATGNRRSYYGKNPKSSSMMNDTMSSYKNYYEDKIVDLFEEMERIRGEYYSVMEKMNDENGNPDSDKDVEHIKNIAIRLGSMGRNPAMDQFQEKTRKQISSLKRQLKKVREQFNDLMGGVNTGSNETRTLIIKPNENKQDWKNLSQKIYKTKQELLTYIKDLQSKIFTNNQIASLTHQLEISLTEAKILLNKKVNQTDYEKSSKRIESRLNNFIKQFYERQGIAQQQEALIAKQPWFCLSCDNQIKNQTGKIGKNINNQKMAGKKVNAESHMVRRNDNSSVSKLPTLHYN